MAKINYTGTKFGRLTITAEAATSGQMRKVEATCECGKRAIFFLKNLKNGHTQSCGCRHIEIMTRHGNSTRSITSPEYVCWASMRSRCSNENNLAFPNYGGRGISVCSQWDKDFSVFLRDMGPRTKGTSIDRIDVNGDYEPGNCRWATKKMQVNNTRVNVFLEHDGRRMTMAQWAEHLDTSVKRIAYRVEHGWPIHMILSTQKYTRSRNIIR